MQKAPGVCPTQRLKIRRHVAEMLGKKKTASLDIFLEVESAQLDHELAFSATFYCTVSRWKGQRTDDMYRAWNRQLSRAGSGKKVRGLAGAVHCELKDAESQWCGAHLCGGTDLAGLQSCCSRNESIKWLWRKETNGGNE